MANLTEWDVLVNGCKQDKIRKIWDFPDVVNSKSSYDKILASDGESYYVCKKGRNTMQSKKIADIISMYQIANDNIMKKISSRQRKNFTKKENAQLDLVLKHHYGKKSHKIAELNPVSGFSGMNKPYQIVLEDSNVTTPIGPTITGCSDFKGTSFETKTECSPIQLERTTPACKLIGGITPYLRPTYRIIYVNSNLGYSKSLLVHELAHTAANHVMYRPSDHHQDFVEAEKLLKKFS